MSNQRQNSMLGLQRNKKKEFSTCSCNSSCDAVLFYESKLKKLKHNNISLAVTLADQRHISQTWYNEVIALKGKLLETQSLLESYGNKKVNSNFEFQKAAEIIKRIVSPLEAAAQDCINHSLGLAGGMKTISHLASTLLNFTDEKMLNLSTHSNHSSGGRKPLISHKISGKNSIHSVEEHYVLNSPAICSPKILHTEREMYNLPYSTNTQESNWMDPIPENSNICKEKDNESHSLEAKAHHAAQFLKDTSEQMSLSIISENPCLEMTDKKNPETKQLDASPPKLKEKDQVTSSFDRGYFLKNTTETPPKRRSSKINRSSVTNQIVESSLNLFQRFSKDLDPNRTMKDLSIREMIEGKYSNSSSDSISSPMFTKTPPRSLNIMTTYQTMNESGEEILRLPSSGSPFDEELLRERCEESLLQVSMGDMSAASPTISPLFESSAEEMRTSPSLSLTSCDSLSFSDLSTEGKDLISTDLTPPRTRHNKIGQGNEAEDTCFLDSSMEITECISKEMLMEIVPTHSEKTKPKRFFKGLDLNEKTVLKPKEKTPYDLSLIERSFVDDKAWKENFPPYTKTSDALDELTTGINDASINGVSAMTKAIFHSPENSQGPESTCDSMVTRSPIDVERTLRKRNRNTVTKGLPKEGKISISPPQQSFLDCTFSLKCETRHTSPTRRKKKGKSYSKLDQSLWMISQETGKISQTIRTDAEKPLFCLADEEKIFKRQEYLRETSTKPSQSTFRSVTKTPPGIIQTNHTNDKDAIVGLSALEHENHVAFSSRVDENTGTAGKLVSEARSTSIHSCSNSRPRRAAAQTKSFKEVSLSKKLRQETSAPRCRKSSKRSRSCRTH